MTKITYIWHDCFVVTTESVTLVFDYWQDPTVAGDYMPAFIKIVNPERPLYVFVSHHHKDHYSRDIFVWSTLLPDVRYILSGDTAKYCRHILSETSTYAGPRPKAGTVTVLKAGEELNDGTIKVKAFGSTDIGNSYLVIADNKSIFHAGDLNAWLWMDESTESEVREANDNYLKIVNNIAAASPKIDFAMFPVDSRIGTGYWTGAAEFVRAINVSRFFPMHFTLGDTHAEQQKLMRDAAVVEKYANPERGEYICLQQPYSTYMCHD